MKTHRIARTLATIAVLALPFGVACAHESIAPEAQIPFVNHGGIYNWQADRDQGLWIQDAHRNWYYATLMGRCNGLSFATAIAFDTRPLDTFDRFSAIVVPGSGRCPVQNFAASDAPPSKQPGKAAS
jgi:hypothetical protein